MKPMLAGKVTDISKLKYPVYATPKIDGIRCLIHPELGPVSRKLKPIPNAHVRSCLNILSSRLDGELLVNGSKNFGETSGAIMRADGEPEFTYYVFDHFFDPIIPCTLDYLSRVASLGYDSLWPAWVSILRPERVNDEAELIALEERYLASGYEGVMLRAPTGPYKFGRSTEREGYLLKLKRFEDAEAVVIGFEEFQHNDNPLERDALGAAKRSAHKANQRAAGTLGALVCKRPDGLEFRIGSGFTAEQRAEIWAERGNWSGAVVKYRFQPHGAKEAPRFPTFLGRRHPDDI